MARVSWIGRPPLYGVTVGALEGAAHAVGIMRREIDMVMAQSGLANLDQLGPDLLLQDPADDRRNQPGA